MMFYKVRLAKIIFILVFLLQSCVSVEKYNAKINKTRTVKELQADVDYVQRKLQKLQPDLYHYIPKKELDFKFDSLRSSLTIPLTSNDFFFKLSPVIASVRQGHLQTFPLTKRFHSAEKKRIKSIGTTPFTQFDFEIFDNKLYIVKNNSKDSSICPGTELVTINGVSPKLILDVFRPTFCSDGFNETFVNFRLAKSFSKFYFLQYGIIDSVSCFLKYNDSTRIVSIRRPGMSKPSNIKKTKEELRAIKKMQIAEKKKRKLQGYDGQKKMYSKQLNFPTKDSSVAVLKIADFVKGKYKKFYKNSFAQLDSSKTKALVIDLRDNTGGSLREISHLYSYLTDSSYCLVNKSEVTSKTSLWHLGLFNNKPLWQKGLQLLLIPAVVQWSIFTFLKTKKGNDGKYYYAFRESRLAHPNTNRYKGKVYVLINGGSFSASSILSTNLHGSKRAKFVGEETGGAYNGCVAGIMPKIVLPNSKLVVRLGLLLCQAPYHTANDGFGILPDVTIKPTVVDRMNGNDPELEWILNDSKQR